MWKLALRVGIVLLQASGTPQCAPKPYLLSGSDLGTEKSTAYYLFLCGPCWLLIVMLFNSFLYWRKYIPFDYVMNFIWNNETSNSFCSLPLFYIIGLVAPRIFPHWRWIHLQSITECLVFVFLGKMKICSFYPIILIYHLQIIWFSSFSFSPVS